MNVGIFFDARRDQGGLYQYALTLIHALYTYEKQNNYSLFHATLESLSFINNDPRWNVVKVPRSELIATWITEAGLLTMARTGLAIKLTSMAIIPSIRKAKVDVMLYVKPSIRSFLWPFPSVLPLHDLGHLLHPEFPEVSRYGECARRQYLYFNAARHAKAVLAPSEGARQQIIEVYNAEPNHVYPLPYLAPTYLSQQPTNADLERVRQCYRLPGKFLFYPATFWQHKNHANLLRALAQVKRKYHLSPALILAGRLDHEYRNLVALTDELGLNEQVRFIGYVPDEDIYPLYNLAFALIMPTFLGPANIPILEAWALGCPVITSDIDGTVEQVGDAGLLVDPHNVSTIEEAIWRLLTDSALRDNLIERGYRQIAKWTPIDFTRRLCSILLEASGITKKPSSS
jgi:glycosyltransferase involved in cell wall biosynthesis